MKAMSFLEAQGRKDGTEIAARQDNGHGQEV
jgi:hypothetical protein